MDHRRTDRYRVADIGAGAPVAQLGFEGAIEVFVRALSWLRSFTHPCLGERVDGIWTIRDAPRKRPDYRKEEWIVWREDPAEVDRIARVHTRGRYFIGAFRTMKEPEAPILAAYKGMGYRLLAREAFFVRELASLKASGLPKTPNDFRIARVTTPELAERLFRAAGSRQILPEHLKDPDSPLRQFVALRGASPVGWVRSVTIGEGAWVSNLYVDVAHRRKGIGAALMAELLLADAEAGVHTSVLLASSAGAMLYPHLGYERIGDLLILVPPKRPF